MKVLITGGAGFIGSHIVDLCVQKGYEVVVVDNLSTGKREYLQKGVSFYEMDIVSERLQDVFEKERPQKVIHQAAQIHVNTSIEDPMLDARVNVLGMIHLLECCRRYGVEKIVYASTAAVYGDPSSLPINEDHPISPLSGYGCSKAAGECYIKMYAQLYGLSYSILRYANVYGIRQDPRGEGGVISIFLNQALREQPLTIFGDGTQTRDYTSVEDIARANIQALTTEGNHLVNLGTGIQTSLNDIILLFDEFTEKKNDIKYLSPREGDISHSVFETKKAVDAINWQAKVCLKQGLASTYAYYLDKHRTMSND